MSTPQPQDEPDPREPYGRVFHEKGRLSVNAELEYPRGISSWEERDPMQRELDMRGASAVAAEAVRDAGLDVAAFRLRVMQYEARLATLKDLARRLREASDAFPGDEGLAYKAAECGRAVQIMDGDVDGEGLLP